MLRGVNIIQILKMLLIILMAAFMLTACGRENVNPEDPNKQAAFEITDETGQKEVAAQHRECWQTGMIDMLYENMGKVALGMYAKITDGALPLIMLAFAIWTIFRLLKFVGSFTEDSPAEIWNEIVRKMFVCLICGLIASSTTQLLWLLNTIVFPIYYAFLELGSEILNLAQGGNAFKANNTGGIYSATISFFQEMIPVSQPVMCSASGVGKASLETLSFPSGPREMMDCMICAVNERLTLGFYLSFKVMAGSGFMPFILGCFILLCFTFVKLGFVFYLVDSIFRFTMMVVILPLLVMFYAFKQTAGWAKHGFVTILNSAALMMFMAVMMSMALLAMEQIISDNSDVFNDSVNTLSFTEFSVPFMCIMLIGFLIVSSVNIAQQVTDSLVGGNSDSKFQSRVGKLAMQASAALFWKLADWVTLGATKRLRDQWAQASKK